MHIEQQIRMEQESSEADSVDEQLKHHLPLQDMVKRAPQDAIRKGNDLLRTLERVSGLEGDGYCRWVWSVCGVRWEEAEYWE